jgi:glycosyltransferase involved in cell wall biosynthesis
MGFNLPHYLYPESPFFRMLSFRDRVRWRIKSQFIKYYTQIDADAYVTQTDDARDRFRAWTGKQRVYTVTNTYGSQYEMPITSMGSRLPERRRDEKRFLILSAYYMHKNFELINEIVRLWTTTEKDNFRFVVTLPQEVFSRIFTSTARPYIINVGPVNPLECPALYKDCDFAFIPTFLECFSAAYPEAMKMGKPILTVDLGFAHTICGQAALFFNPTDPIDAYKKMRHLAYNSSIQEVLRQQGIKRLSSFSSAHNRARRYLEICEEISE